MRRKRPQPSHSLREVVTVFCFKPPMADEEGESVPSFTPAQQEWIEQLVANRIASATATATATATTPHPTASSPHPTAITTAPLNHGSVRKFKSATRLGVVLFMVGGGIFHPTYIM